MVTHIGYYQVPCNQRLPCQQRTLETQKTTLACSANFHTATATGLLTPPLSPQPAIGATPPTEPPPPAPFWPSLLSPVPTGWLVLVLLVLLPHLLAFSGNC